MLLQVILVTTEIKYRKSILNGIIGIQNDHSRNKNVFNAKKDKKVLDYSKQRDII